MLEFLKNKKKIIIFDIGANKIAGISYKLENGNPTIISMDYKKSKGIRRNNFLDTIELSSVIKEVYKKISKGKKEKKEIIFSNITDSTILTNKHFSEISAGKLGVSKKEIRKVYRKCISESQKKNKKLIHSFPLKFTIDESYSTSEPIGKKCKKLGMTCLNLMVDEKIHNKLAESFVKNKIIIKNFFDSGVASAYACLTESEKKEGSICIDIGGSTTKTTAFLNGRIVYHRIISIAGNDVTNDISQGLQIPEESAELIKIIHGTINPTFNEKIDIDIESNKGKIINKNLLYGIIRPRYDEIFEIIRDNIFDDIYARVGIKSIILTGGGSKIFGIANLCSSIFNRKVRIGQIEDSRSFFFNKPEFSTLLGLIKLTKNPESFNHLTENRHSKFSTVFDKLDNWIEESYA